MLVCVSVFVCVHVYLFVTADAAASRGVSRRDFQQLCSNMAKPALVPALVSFRSIEPLSLLSPSDSDVTDNRTHAGDGRAHARLRTNLNTLQLSLRHIMLTMKH